jgi:3'-phosphoadenosine 5'-phosphosulfate sulfotransferase (PAPS reductase)/FAD synthetase
MLRELSPGERLARFRREVEGTVVFTTSFGLEDQVILHLLADQTAEIDVVTLDTDAYSPKLTSCGPRPNDDTGAGFVRST